MSKNHLLLKAGYGNPDMHSHSASHIIVGLEGDMKVCVNGENVVCRGALLPSGVNHTVDSFGSPLLVFMLDITSKVSEQITDFTILTRQEIEQIISAWRLLDGGRAEEDYEAFWAKVTAALRIRETGSRISDERIIQAMHFVKEHPDEDITIKDAAESVYLSEGRFSHLFKEETGIAFSGYLLMQKVFCAYLQIAEGASITEASLAAGFSTPSHFATVNKKMFGITARDLSGSYRLHRIADI